MTERARDVVVVGAGLCGLAAAWREHQAGRDVLLLEASPRVGGVIRTDVVGPYRVERSAATFPSTAKSLLALHASLPSAPAMRSPPPECAAQFLWTNRGLVRVPRTPPALLRSSLLSVGAKVRAVSEGMRGPRRSHAPESAHGLVRRRFGRAVADRFLAPMTLGIYGTSPHDLGAADAFPAVVTMEREAGSVLRALVRRRGAPARSLLAFEGGMETFPRAIASALGDAVRTNAPVANLSVARDVVHVAIEGGDAVPARRVILAIPARDQARLVAPISPAAADVLAAVRTVPMAVAAVGIAPGGSPPIPAGFGFLRGPGTRGRILGAAFASSLDPSVVPPGHALLTVYLGGGDDPKALELSDDDVRWTIERDLARALGGPVRVDTLSVHRWPRAIPVLSPGHRARMASAQALLAPQRVALSGSHVTGVSVDACCGAGG